MTDACLCPRCRGETALRAIVPYKKHAGRIDWMCKTCAEGMKKEWWEIVELVPIAYRDMAQYQCWARDDQ